LKIRYYLSSCTHLHSVPPLSSPHFGIYSFAFGGIRENLLGLVDYMRGQLGVSPETSNGLKWITVSHSIDQIRKILKVEIISFPFASTIRNFVNGLV
jgi:hypothetical protein